MRINIYYGGRGLIEDPTIYAINKITEVLEELRVEVVRYNLYEEKRESVCGQIPGHASHQCVWWQHPGRNAVHR